MNIIIAKDTIVETHIISATDILNFLIKLETVLILGVGLYGLVRFLYEAHL